MRNFSAPGLGVMGRCGWSEMGPFDSPIDTFVFELFSWLQSVSTHPTWMRWQLPLQKPLLRRAAKKVNYFPAEEISFTHWKWRRLPVRRWHIRMVLISLGSLNQNLQTNKLLCKENLVFHQTPTGGFFLMKIKLVTSTISSSSMMQQQLCIIWRNSLTVGKVNKSADDLSSSLPALFPDDLEKTKDKRQRSQGSPVR